jgi:hypothetical protein
MLLVAISKCLLSCGQEYSTLCIHFNQRLIGQYLFLEMLKLNYIFGSQLSSKEPNRQAKQ